jgi:hypothetical protein
VRRNHWLLVTTTAPGAIREPFASPTIFTDMAMQHGKLFKFNDGNLVRGVYEEGNPSRLLFFVRDVELMTGEPDTIRFEFLRHLGSKIEVVKSSVTSGMNLRGSGGGFVSLDLLENLKPSDFCSEETPKWLFDQIKPEIDAFVAKCYDVEILDVDISVWRAYWHSVGERTYDAKKALSMRRIGFKGKARPKDQVKAQGTVQQQLPLQESNRPLKAKLRFTPQTFDVFQKAVKLQAQAVHINKSVIDLKAQLPHELHKEVDEYAMKIQVEARV